jgi:hypothetical protein
MEDREMLMKDFRKLISPNAILDIRSRQTDEHIKTCRAIELTEEDMQLNIEFVHASTYFNNDHKAYLGMFILSVYEV